MEDVVTAALHRHLKGKDVGTPATINPASFFSLTGELSANVAITKADLALHIDRIVVYADRLEIVLLSPALSSAPDHAQATALSEGQSSVATDLSAAKILNVPWQPTPSRARKGIATAPLPSLYLAPEKRDLLLKALARARQWVRDVQSGTSASLDDLAKAEGKSERHIRLLLPLACLSPRIVTAIAQGTAPAHLTITSLAQALPMIWSEQELRIGLSPES